jgi:methylated-DNA-protein-cysteine methyltransferase-like protein
MPAEAAAFRSAVLEKIREIPEGRVCSYGTIARLAGYEKHARHVGHVLRGLRDSEIDWALHRRVERRERRRNERRERRRRERAGNGNAPDGPVDADASDTEQTATEHANRERSASPILQSSDAAEPEARERVRDPTPDPDGPVPWHRVLNSQGRISARFPNDSVDLQAKILQYEGLDVYKDGWNKWTVSVRTYGWNGGAS